MELVRKFSPKSNKQSSNWILSSKPPIWGSDLQVWTWYHFWWAVPISRCHLLITKKHRHPEKISQGAKTRSSLKTSQQKNWKKTAKKKHGFLLLYLMLVLIQHQPATLGVRTPPRCCNLHKLGAQIHPSQVMLQSKQNRNLPCLRLFETKPRQIISMFPTIYYYKWKPKKRQSIFIPVNHGWPAQSLDGTWTNNAQQNRNMFIRTNSYKYYLDKRSYKFWRLSRSKRRVRAVSTWAQPPQKGALEVHQN